MNAERSRWPTILVSILALAVLYVLSFGPACWITSRFGLGTKWMPVVYRPILHAFPNDADPMSALSGNLHGGIRYEYPEGILSSYARFAAHNRWQWRRSAEFDVIDLNEVRTTEWQWEWCDSTK